MGWKQKTTCSEDENLWLSEKECKPIGAPCWVPSDSELLGALTEAGLTANSKPDAAAAVKVQGLLTKMCDGDPLSSDVRCILGHWLAGAHDRYDPAWLSSALPSAQTECNAGLLAPSVSACIQSMYDAGYKDSAWLIASCGNAKQAAAQQQSDQQAAEDSQKIYQQAGFAVGGAGLVVVVVLVLLALAKK